MAVWLVLAVVIALVVGRQCASYYRLMKSDLTTTGTVQAKRPHDVVEYNFVANGRAYTGRGILSRKADRSFYDMNVGDAVLVHYLSDTPEINSLGNPRRLFSNELSLVLLAIAIFPTMVVAVLAWRFSRGGPSPPRRPSGQ